MIDALIFLAMVVLCTAGFSVLYVVWMCILAKISKVPWKEALKWWD